MVTTQVLLAAPKVIKNYQNIDRFTFKHRSNESIGIQRNIQSKAEIVEAVTYLTKAMNIMIQRLPIITINCSGLSGKQEIQELKGEINRIRRWWQRYINSIDYNEMRLTDKEIRYRLGI